MRQPTGWTSCSVGTVRRSAGRYIRLNSTQTHGGTLPSSNTIKPSDSGGRTMRWPGAVVSVLGVLAFGASPGSAAPSEQEQRLLHLGSALGAQRLEILAWPQGGDAFRLRPTPADPPDRARPAKGRFREYDVLDAKRLTEAQVALLAGTLLDTEVFESLAIRKPARPGGGGRGAGKMCGGLRPIIGIQFKDVEDRQLDVLLCFACNEVAFASVKSSTGPNTGDARRFSISHRGAARLIRHLAEIFPDDKLIEWLRTDREKRPTEGGAVP